VRFLALPKQSELTIEVIKEKLLPLFGEKGLRLVVLFGSVAKGKVHKKSDIDIAFLFDKPADVLTLTNKVIQILHTDNVDIVDLFHASPLLKFSVAKTGVPLFEKNQGEFNLFKALAFKIYIDAKKIREARSKAIAAYLKRKGIA
jgi:predicted nucleotidyltransferase